ncbi:MAG: type III PLP-dependent enzyme [Pseudomonadota bacterium]
MIAVSPKASNCETALRSFADAAHAVGVLHPDIALHCLRPHVIAGQARQFAAAFPGKVYYAVKANPHEAVLKALWYAGVRNYDVASIGEIEHVAAHLPRAGMAFMNPVKPRSAIARAYFDFGVRTFALDAEWELAKILRETGGARDLRLVVRLATPDGHSDWHVSSKFGASVPDGIELLRAARRSAALTGLTFHVGSLCLNPKAYRQALGLCGQVARGAGGGLDLIDVGGGFPVAYDGLTPPPLADYMAEITAGLADLPLRPDAAICAEPGRALSAPGGSVVVRVLGRRGRQLFLNDGQYGGLASPGPPPPNLGLPLRLLGGSSGDLVPFEIFGPTCDGTDKLGGAFLLPESVAEGDWIEIGQHGAYGSTLRSDFNGFQASAFVCVDDGPLLDTPGYSHPRKKDRNP